MLSLSEDNQSGVIEAFNSTSRYLDDLLNIDNNFFDSMVNRIYPSKLQLNKANVSDAEASFLDLHLSISDDFVKTKIYDKRDDFDIVNFPFLDGDVPRSASYGVYISQLIRFARVSSHVDDFNTRNKVLTAKLLRQGYRHHKLPKAFSKFYRRHFDIVSKYNSRKENPQKLTQLSSRSHPRHLVRKSTAQKDITIDTTSDSQVNSNFPNKWSPASLTFNNYFYLFLYLYIT